MDIFYAAPPVTRTLTAGAVGLSCLAYAGLVPFKWIIFYRPWIIKLVPEIWRLVTPFLLTGPGLSIIFDAYFLYTYGVLLETDSPRFSQPGDFFTYVVFNAIVILGTCGFVLGGFTFLQALILAFAYTASQDNPNKKTSLFILTFPMRFLPFGMLALTFVMGGPQAALQQATGLLAAHLYDFLTRIWPTFGGGRRMINTPAFVKRWFTPDRLTARNTSYGTAFAARPQAQTQSPQGSSRGWTSGFTGNGNFRGSGHRLG